jgi:hypothetical protein
MDAAKRIILLLALVVVCALPASALTPSAPENRVWEKITGTLETHQEATPQVPQSHQEETTATAGNALECFRAGKGARSEGKDLQEKLSMDEAKAGAGKPYGGKLSDPKYDPVTGTHNKMEHNHDHGDGTSTEVHYDVNRTTGQGSGYKIKDDTNANSRGNMSP